MAIADTINSIREHLTADYESLENIGAELENVDKNIENIASVVNGIYDNLPKTTGEDANLSLTTLKGKMNIIPKGYTSQNGTPAPETPIDIEVVTGEQEVKVENDNLLQAKLQTTTASGITITNNNNGTFTINGTNTSTGTTSFRLDQSTQSGTDNLQNYEDGTYTLDLGIANENIGINLMQNSTWTTFISTGFNTRLKSGTLTNITNTFIYIGIKGSATIDNVIIKPMFVKGSYTTSTIPEFTPHQEQTQTISLGDIELCKIGNYQDYLYKSNDKWYKKENIGKYICKSNDNWLTNAYGTNSWRLSTISPLVNDSIIAIMSTKFTGVSKNNRNTDNSVIYVDGNNLFTIRNTPYTTQALVQSGMANEPIYYILATPNDIEITNETLIEQLDNLEKLKSYNGVTNISSSGSLPMILNVSALKGE